MDITSIYFICFFVILFLIYYLIPAKHQWLALLGGSLFFYGYSGIRNLIYIFLTSMSTFIATNIMQQITVRQKEFLKDNKEKLTKEEKSIYKKKQKSYKKRILIITLIFNLGLLSSFKYIHFLLEQINWILEKSGWVTINNTFSLLIPLGISFYTFQTMGYLIDVYWGDYKAEKNYFKVLLFVSFFPQMIQGPISNFRQLTDELFKKHTFSLKNYCRGFERTIWGFFKKLVVANTLSPFVLNVFENYSSYTGLTVLTGAFMYSIQIYADFSGYMDIVCGLCEMLDITLAENFERPYFSKSIAEYWRRWHITLGTWFKTYIYYPVATAKWNQKMAKKIGLKIDVLPASIALIVVWLTTGLWHGASWAYIAWGGVNGFFMILSLWMEPVYASWKYRLNINENAYLWKVFQIVRTFVLVTFIKVLPEVGTLGEGFGLIGHIFMDHQIPKSLQELLPFVEDMTNVYVVLIGVCVMLIVSILQRTKSVREYFEILPGFVRVFVLACFFLFIVYFGIPVSNGIQFMYAQF